MLTDRLKAEREKLGINKMELSKRLGIPYTTYCNYESGLREPNSEMLKKIAMFYSVTIDYLLGLADDEDASAGAEKGVNLKAPTITTDVTVFPVIGDIGAGYDKIAVEDWTGDTVEIPNTYLRGRKKEDFIVLRVKGNSMYPLYHDGDKVLVLKQSTLNYSGEIGAILYNDESVTLKRIEYIPGENWLNMVPINPEYAPKHIEGEALEHCTVIGIPKLLIREI